MKTSVQSAPTPWPALPWDQWQPTADTLHMLTQIVGKTRLWLTPLQNHWWNVPLYVSARGLTTSAIPWRGDLIEIEFNFPQSHLEIHRASGARATVALAARPVADFYARYLAALRRLGIEVTLWPVPVEIPNPIRFDQDHVHASWDPDAVARFHQVLIRVEAVLKRFSTGFQGKVSPVHFFWGSFDLAVTRFSGRPAPGPPRPDRIQQEAYSHEVSSAGFWPGNGGFGQPAFYSYAAPVPPGLAEQPVSPGSWNSGLGEFLLPYDEVRLAPNPEQALLDFLQSTYSAAADTAHWDRTALDRPIAAPPCG